jgi:hypothetical protein
MVTKYWSEKLNGNISFGDLDIYGEEILSLRLNNTNTEIQRVTYFANVVHEQNISAAYGVLAVVIT